MHVFILVFIIHTMFIIACGETRPEPGAATTQPRDQLRIRWQRAPRQHARSVIHCFSPQPTDRKRLHVERASRSQRVVTAVVTLSNEAQGTQGTREGSVRQGSSRAATCQGMRGRGPGPQGVSSARLHARLPRDESIQYSIVNVIDTASLILIRRYIVADTTGGDTACKGVITASI